MTTTTTNIRESADLYTIHYDRAVEAMGAASEQPSDDPAAVAWYAEAQIHATLALAAATANNVTRCGVHCAATGC